MKLYPATNDVLSWDHYSKSFSNDFTHSLEKAGNLPS